jgi:hypothetical protein
MTRRLIIFLFLAVATAKNMPAQMPAGKFRVSGKAVNAIDGHPLVGAEISIGLAQQFNENPQKILTGDDGGFAFTVAEAGKYMLVGESHGFRQQSYEQHGFYNSAVVVGPDVNSENLVFRLRPDGRILGTIVDEEHEPIRAAMIRLFRTDASGGLRQTYLEKQAATDDRGHYRLAHLEPGCYYLVVSAQPWYAGVAANYGFKADRSVSDAVYPTTFYPGVTDSAQATQLAVNEAQDVTADFTLATVTGFRVRLNHLNTDPEKPRSATLEQRVFGTTIHEAWERGVPVDDGVEMKGVSPGQYVLNIETYDGSRAKRASVLNIASDMEFDADSAPTVPAIRGVVRMEGGRGLDTSRQTVVRLWNARTNEILDSNVNEKGEINFDADILTPGTYSVSARTGVYSTIAKLSATGAQVTGQSIRIAGGKPVQLEIELSSSLSKIDGLARRQGQPFPGAMILLVPENPEVNLSLFRRDQSDSDGTFTLLDVLPGRYKLLAIEDAWDLEWANPALLKPRLDRAQTIKVQPNKTYQTAINVE